MCGKLLQFLRRKLCTFCSCDPTKLIRSYNSYGSYIHTYIHTCIWICTSSVCCFNTTRMKNQKKQKQKTLHCVLYFLRIFPFLCGKFSNTLFNYWKSRHLCSLLLLLVDWCPNTWPQLHFKEVNLDLQPSTSIVELFAAD